MGIRLNNLKYLTYMNICFIIVQIVCLCKYFNSNICICFLMFSKKNEPKEFPEKFSKKFLKATKIIKKYLLFLCQTLH